MRKKQRNRALLKQFVENAPAPIAMFDRDMRYIMTSRRFLSDYKLENQDLIGRSHYDVFPEIPECWKEIHQRCLAGATQSCEEDLFPRADGETDRIRWQIQPWYEASGEIGGVILFPEDITERKQMEEAVRRSETSLRTTFEQAAVGIAHVSPGGRFIRVNQKLCAILGCAREELLGKTFQELVHSGTSISIIEDTSGRKRIEKELLESEARFRSLFQNNHAVMLVIDPADGAIMDANPAACAYYGWSKETLTRMNISDINILTPAQIQEEMNLARTNRRNHFEFRHRLADGTEHDVEVYSGPIGIGDRDSLYSVIFDISERKAAALALQESEARYRNLLEVAPIGIAVHQDGKIVFTNPVGLRILGAKSDDQLIGKPIAEIIHPDGLEKARDRIQRMMAGETGLYPVEDRYIKLDGIPIDVEVMASPLTYNGRPAVQVIVSDITERKLAADKLREERNKFAKIVAVSPGAICMFSRKPDGSAFFPYASPAIEEVYGLAPEQLAQDATDVRKRIHAQDLPRVRDQIIESARSLSPWNSEFRYNHPKKGAVWIESRFMPSRQADGGTVWYGFVLDVTDRQRADTQILLSNRVWLNTFNAISDTVCVISGKHEFLKINAAGCLALGLPEEQIIGRKCYELFHGTNAPMCGCPCEESIKTRKPCSSEHEENGRFYELGAWPVLDAAGNIESITHIVRDITIRKQQEIEQEKLRSQFIQAQKMESVGRLAGGVAHDYNNILSVILGYAELALNKVKPEDPLHGDLKEIYNAAGRSRDITRQLLAFARKETIAPEVLDLNAAIEGMLKIMRRLVGEDIHLVWLPGNELWPVSMDPTQIDQMLANLCVNARDAITDVGKIIIATETMTFDAAYCADHTGFSPGDFVTLAVSDDGCGMDRETSEKIFEPFFTTKGVGKGTGLGLAMVYGIVKQNDGFINVYSEPGQGTTFRIYLPRHAGDAAEQKASCAAEPPCGRGETVLIVEDDGSILKLAKTMLERLGYRVMEARSPGLAIDLAKQHAGQIHLLITDVVMPEMNGRDLADQLHTLYPELKILFMSGYTADVIAHRGVLDAGVNFIQKPFSNKDLAIKVHKALMP
ncbi:MAG: PAS domain S-box protein [Desulfatitalea sp.]|nr:PAS domain S-box protein [Desulfatitalea sp.]NNJ99774.1 PAS domain S-box protein [Desulfatitalea sp.]